MINRELGSTNYYSNKIGDLDLKRASQWRDAYSYGLPYDERPRVWQKYWSERGYHSGSAGPSLELLQHQLHEQQQNVSERDGNVVLVGYYRYQWRDQLTRTRTPYHEDILENWEAFIHELKSQGSSITNFRLHDITLPPSFFATKLMPILNDSELLSCLELSECGLKPSDIGCITKLVKKSTSLATLNLSKNKEMFDSVRSMKSLATTISNHPQLSFLDCSQCALGGKPEILDKLLGGCNQLNGLVLDENDIATDAVTHIAAFLKKNATLTVLSLEENEMGNENAIILNEAIEKNSTLEQICLRSNTLIIDAKVGAKTITAIMNQLSHVDLSSIKCWGYNAVTQKHGRGGRDGNICDLKGAKVIAKCLERNPVLTTLNLSVTRMNSKCAEAIAKALKSNTNLQHLDLSWNGITEKCVPAFVNALQNNSTLLSLDLSDNDLRVKTGRGALVKGALCDATSLQTIAESNHTCVIRVSESGRYMNDHTFEDEMQGINSLDECEGKKIRLKVVLAMFKMNKDLFDPRNFADVPLELVPRLLEIVQLEFGVNGFGKGLAKNTHTRRSAKHRKNRTLARIYEVMIGWPCFPSLFVRGPGKLRKKRKRKVADEDEDWAPSYRGKVGTTDRVLRQR